MIEPICETTRLLDIEQTCLARWGRVLGKDGVGGWGYWRSAIIHTTRSYRIARTCIQYPMLNPNGKEYKYRIWNSVLCIYKCVCVYMI